MTRQRQGPEVVAVREREARVLRLRQAGLTFAEIGEAIDVSERRAHQLFRRALGRIVQEPGEDQIALEISRLDQLQRAVWAKAMGGNLAAVDRALAIAKRRADLLGLDKAAPAEQTVRVQVDLLLTLLQKSLLAAFPTTRSASPWPWTPPSANSGGSPPTK